MSFSHIAAHNENAIAVKKVFREGRSAATSKRCTQTGYCGAVSYTSLVLNRGNTQATVEQLFNQIVLFDIKRRAAKGGNT